GLIGSLDPVIVLRYLLSRGVVRHQSFNDRRSGQTTYRKFLHAVHEHAAADLAVNKQVVELYGLFWQFRSRWLHGPSPFAFQKIYHLSAAAAQRSALFGPLENRQRIERRACSLVDPQRRCREQKFVTIQPRCLPNGSFEIEVVET